MTDVRKLVSDQLGALLIANLEQAARIRELETEIEALKKTQSEGKAQAEQHLQEQESK